MRLDVTYEAEGRFHLELPVSAPAGPLPAMLLVHGYGQDPMELVRFARPLAPGAVLLAPEGPSAFRRRSRARQGHPGAAHVWIALPDRASEDRRNAAFLDAVLRSAAERVALDPDRTVVLGYSQGAGVALHWWTARPRAARGLIGLVGGFHEAYRPRLEAVAGRPVLWVTGLEDPAYPVPYTDALVERFSEAQVDLEDVRLEAGHDVLEPAAVPVHRWLTTQGLGTRN